MNKALAGAALVSLATVCPALANPRALGVWDSQGTLMGDLISPGQVAITLGDTLARFAFQYKGLIIESSFLYTQSNCQGPAYIDVGDDPPPRATLGENGDAWYAAGPIAQIDAVSTWIGSEFAGGCQPINGGNGATYYAAQAKYAKIQVSPPLCASATKVACK